MHRSVSTSLCRLVVSVLGCALVLGTAFAQPAADSPPVQAKLYFLSISNTALPPLGFLNGKTKIPVEIPSDFVSQPYTYVGPALFTLLSKQPGQPTASLPSPPPVHLPVASVELPPEGGEFLLVVGRAGEQVLILRVDFSTASVPADAYLFWNLTKRPLAVTLGDTKNLVPAGQRSTFEVPSGADYMPLRVFDETTGALRQVFASRHLHRAGMRQLVFLTEGSTPDRVRLRMITQRTAPPLVETAAR